MESNSNRSKKQTKQQGEESHQSSEYLDQSNNNNNNNHHKTQPKKSSSRDRKLSQLRTQFPSLKVDEIRELLSQNGYDIQATVDDLCLKTKQDPRAIMRLLQEAAAASSSSSSSSSKKKSQQIQAGHSTARRLHTSEEVYNRVKWDTEHFNTADFTIGYDDRFIGVKEVEFDKWNVKEVTSESFIPWHRVQYFKHKGQLVWDRQSKLDKVFAYEYDQHHQEDEEKSNSSDDARDEHQDEQSHDPNNNATTTTTTTSSTSTSSTKSNVNDHTTTTHVDHNHHAIPTTTGGRQDRQSTRQQNGTKQQQKHDSNSEHAKVVRSAVILMPPEHLWPAIQQIRAKFDKSFERWMPHVNLLYPFVPAAKFDQSLKQLTAAVGSIEPFQVTLRTFGYFKHAKSSTMWLKPEAANDAVGRLQGALEGAFPFCSDLSDIAEGGQFAPHLSVGQFAHHSIDKTMHSYELAWQPLTFVADCVYVIARDNDEPFRLHYRIPFKQAHAVPRPLYTVVPIYDCNANAMALSHCVQRRWQPLSSDAAVTFESHSVPASKQSLRVLTWNVLFDLHDANLLYPKERLPLLSAVLKASNADVIVLQEITKPFLQQFLPLIADWAEGYFVGDADGAHMNPFGVLILSRVPPRAIRSFQFSGGQKTYTVAEFIVNEQLVTVVGIHLVSNRVRDAQQKRLMQLRELVANHWNSSANVLLVGDFNYGDADELSLGVPQLANHSTDVWRQLRDKDDGYTYDPELNTMAAVTTVRNRRERFDRIVLKNSPTALLKATTVELLGTQSHQASDGKPIFPSDHFAVVCEFQVTTSAVASSSKSE